MIQFVNVSKNFGRQQVIVEANFAIHDGERVGFVGPNGAGKSTLLEMLSGRMKPDHGECSYPGSQRLGYVRQQLNAHAVQCSLIEYTENALPELNAIQEELSKVEMELSHVQGGEQERLLKRLGDLQTRFEHLGGYELRNRAEATLSGLGFSPSRFNDPFVSFSGGWQIRAELTRILVSQPDILVLDEPTNYLDVPAVEWLSSYLKGYPGTLLLVSHDRYLLNTLTNVTLEVMGGQVTRYPGNYAQYMEARVARHENLLAQKRNLDHKKEQLERFIDRFRYKATKAAQAQSRQKQLDKLEDIQVQSITAHGPRIRLPLPPRSGDEVVRLEDVSFSYDGKRDVVSHCDLRLMRGEHVALVGLNGMGKTTLLRLIAGRLAPTAGRVVTGTNVLPGYQSQDYAETMDPNATVYETAKSYASERSEADIRELLGGFGFSGEAIDKKVQVLSGGEKVRLGLARLLLKPLNFLMLDEPTTHLNIHAREALQEALSNYPGTIALVSHDIEFVRGIAKDIYDLRPGKVTRYYGDYDYYREKLAQEQAAQAAAELAAPPPKPVPAVAPKKVQPSAPKTVEKAVPQRSYKDQKRAESQLRQTFGKLKRPYESQVSACEEKIAALEKEQQAIYEKLNTPAADTDFAALNKRLAEINQESENETWRWEEASTSLEKLEEEFQERLAVIQRGEM
ncbi:MAG: ABC-F family ATP-binding cassette domain-containing protein [Victivallales bacterium]|nr:ABC-F family ATP-binding cassette domain-containing protein [Victivallales bacterium]